MDYLTSMGQCPSKHSSGGGTEQSVPSRRHHLTGCWRPAIASDRQSSCLIFLPQGHPQSAAVNSTSEALTTDGMPTGRGALMLR